MAEYKIISDSSCELPKEYISDERFSLVPFRFEIDGVPIRDNGEVNSKSLVNRFGNSQLLSEIILYSAIIHHS